MKAVRVLVQGWREAVGHMSLRGSEEEDPKSSGGCPSCNALRRNSRAVDDWAGGVTEATFDEGAPGE